MRRIAKIFLIACVAGWMTSPAHAQTEVCFKQSNTTPGCQVVTPAAPLPVNASVTASITGFQPAVTGTPFTANNTGVTGTLPAGAVVAAFNTGTTNTAFCKLGASATTGDIAIPPQSWFAFTVGAATQLTCITSSGTTGINMVGGSGLPTGAGGGGGGSGAVTGAQAASTTMQNAALANGNGTNLTVIGYQTALVNVNCSVACSGGTTINFEGTDSTGTYFSIAGIPVTGASAAVLSTTTSGQFWVPVSGLTTIRARISNYSAGTITVTGTPVFGTNSTVAQVANALASVQANNGTNGAAGTVTTPITEQNGTAYANKSNWTSGTGNGTTTGAITVIAAPAANSLYIKSVQCARDDAGTTAMRVTFSDAQSSVMVLPNNGGGGGNNATFDPPIKVAATTAFTVTPSSAITTIRCNAQGFIAP